MTGLFKMVAILVLVAFSLTTGVAGLAHAGSTLIDGATAGQTAGITSDAGGDFAVLGDMNAVSSERVNPMTAQELSQIHGGWSVATASWLFWMGLGIIRIYVLTHR